MVYFLTIYTSFNHLDASPERNQGCLDALCLRGGIRSSPRDGNQTQKRFLQYLLVDLQRTPIRCRKGAQNGEDRSQGRHRHQMGDCHRSLVIDEGGSVNAPYGSRQRKGSEYIPDYFVRHTHVDAGEGVSLSNYNVQRDD